jgi:outer membrane immunogenic protein
MRTISVVAALLLGIPLSAAGQSSFLAQTGAFLETNKPDVALTYQFARSNTQPGQCGCFILNGAGLSASWAFRPDLAAVVEGDADFASNGPGTGNSITLVSGVAGARYRLPVQPPGRRAPQFFAEAMAGGGHAGGGIAGAADGSFGFVGRGGGGFDEVLTERFAFRLEADYAPTTFANGVNNHQNNLLIAVGFVFHWARPR